MAEAPNDILGIGQIKGIIKWVILAIMLIIVVVAFIAIRKKILAKKLQAQIDAEKTVTINGTTLNIPIGTIAANINDAFYNHWGGEDEERAISELMNCPKALIPQLSEAYFNISGGKSLKGDFIKYLSTDEFNQVRNILG
jgi:hypothetical protein